MLAQAILGHIARLLTQHPIHHSSQRLAAQHLASLGYQLVVDRIGKRQFKQALEVRVQVILHCCVADVALGPLGCDPFLEPRRITAVVHAQHQVRTQAIEQAIAVLHVGANLPFQQHGHPWQKLRLQLALIGVLDHRVDGFALVQATSLLITHIAVFREDLGRGIAAAEGLECCH
ncbi:hypothetical protein D3C81_1465680 [compost metagenome]